MKKQEAILGIIGGMGPLASAEFMQRIYRYHSYEHNEQSAPFIIQYSDPTVPDRTENFLKENESPVMEALLKALNFMERAGAEKIVICCFTIHHLLPKLSARYRNRITSLVDVSLSQLLKTKGKFLLLATKGTRQMKLFESHPVWMKVADRVSLLSEYDQEQVHFYIYNYLKKGCDPSIIEEKLNVMIKKYSVDGVIVACTELHLLNEMSAEGRSRFYPFEVIDALDVIAKNPFLQTANTDNSLVL